MCGIFGHTRPGDHSPERSRAALQTLAHRGPDQWGEWRDERVYLGHRRLSILDLSERGRQPMTGPGGDIVIAVNGEIYNYPALRKELESEHEFVSRSDSEIVIHGYRAWGLAGLLERIDGMYAFCLYDRPRGKVFLARDRVGIKPLYYACAGGLVAWASELKAIRLFMPERLSIDHTALYDFLTYLYVPTPKTLYREARKLPPASYAEVDVETGAVRVERYWTLPLDERPVGPTEAAGRLFELIDRSVREQLMSDVPVGVFLSGGMDSSAVTFSANRHAGHIQTFCIQIDEPGHDESPYARKVAEALGTEHHARACRSADAEAFLGLIQGWYDEPFGDTSAIPTHMVSRFSRERITVALSGDGGDELFGGYRWYSAMLERAERPPFRAPWARALTAPIDRWGGRSLAGRVARRAAFEWVWDDVEVYIRLMGGLLREEKRRYARAWDIPRDYDEGWFFRAHWNADLPLMTRLQVLDFHTYLPDDILAKVDRASMQVALEVRVPLLSREIIEFAFSLPESVRCGGGTLKALMKQAYRDKLPRDILDKPKWGFSIPIRQWAFAHGRLPSLQERILALDYREAAGPVMDPVRRAFD